MFHQITKMVLPEPLT